ncbi:hypothetical protein PIN31009_02831 [Pandoraea iniqua]|uniref:hypothetical protein n=1 Tax=Pandoraea iniqua TaxID=2508288 RepID=UPI00123FDADD|nr:hypothetical protein [Pandoraea iniqua]VVE15044.1 hypothetical protein PIN31009_02831 [Pandoraea iniqua]
MNLRELITDANGRLSHLQLWPSIASAAATAVFLYQGFTHQLTIYTWLIYLGCVGGYSAVGQWIVAWQSLRGSRDASSESLPPSEKPP